MKILLAGATGVIGRELLPLLLDTNDEVAGTASTEAGVTQIRSAGAKAFRMNALNYEEVRTTFETFRPDLVIHQLTAIPSRINIRKFDRDFAATNELRTKGTQNLIDAAVATGCSRMIAQSYAATIYERAGDWIKKEDAPVLLNPEPAISKTIGALLFLENAILSDVRLKGTVLRYGSFYGPGTAFGEGGSVFDDLRNRKFPVIGDGKAYWSFVHVDDAASGTMAAVNSSHTGIYNICDNEPAPLAEWLPTLASAIGAPKPRHIPEWLGRLFVGPQGVAMMNELRGASNQKAKADLGWTPSWGSWRTGFYEAPR